MRIPTASITALASPSMATAGEAAPMSQPVADGYPMVLECDNDEDAGLGSFLVGESVEGEWFQGTNTPSLPWGRLPWWTFDVLGAAGP